MIFNITDIEAAKLLSKENNIGLIQTNINAFLKKQTYLYQAINNSPVISSLYTAYQPTLLNCDNNYNTFQDAIITHISKKDNKNVIAMLKQICKDFNIINDVNNIYSEIIYSYQKVLISYYSNGGNYMNMIDIYNEGSLFHNTNQMILALFRPLQKFISNSINFEGITLLNNDYITFIFIYLSLNIIVDFVICYVIYRFILIKYYEINKSYTVLIDCLKL
jgi:hypothetical protein